jgi:hypothetical protein
MAERNVLATRGMQFWVILCALTATAEAQTLITPSPNVPGVAQAGQVDSQPVEKAVVAVPRPRPTPSLYVGAAQSNARTLASPGFVRVAPTVGPSLVSEGLVDSTFPVRIGDAVVDARGAVIVDSTRLDPNASGLFLPSAIPVRGEAFFGTGERATLQGQGTSVAISWASDITPQSPVFGAVRLQVFSLTTDEFRVNTPQAWLQWQDVLFGVTDSLFTDLDVNPDTIDLNGPNARPYFVGGHPQIRCTLLEPTEWAIDPSGFYVNASIELPNPDLYVPSDQDYAAFARYPDCVMTVKYQEGEWQTHRCPPSDKRDLYDESWHVQLGTLLRDLGVENAAASVREEAVGWGVQLSARVTVFGGSDGCDLLRDYAFLSFVYGEGIGEYFSDLRTVSATNDAAYNSTTNALTALPLSAFVVGYQHQWTDTLRSTAVYSRIDLDSTQIPGGDTTTLPYRRGEYISINLMYHLHPCVEDGAHNFAEHHFFAGVEYLYGVKENLSGATGDDHRVMCVLAASK